MLVGDKKKSLAALLDNLNANLDYIRWRETIMSVKDDTAELATDDFSRLLAEKCCSLFESYVNGPHLADSQIKKLSEVCLLF
jgi:hypothetical protein